MIEVPHKLSQEPQRIDRIIDMRIGQMKNKKMYRKSEHLKSILKNKKTPIATKARQITN